MVHGIRPYLLSEFFWLYYCENAGDVEAKVKVALSPAISCLANECALGHAGGIGEHELEYVATGFNIYADRSGIVRFAAVVEHIGIIEPVIILARNSDAPAYFDPAAYANGKSIIV